MIEEAGKGLVRRSLASLARVTVGAAVIIGVYAASPFIQTVGQSNAEEMAEKNRLDAENAQKLGQGRGAGEEQSQSDIARDRARTNGGFTSEGPNKGSARWDQLMNKLDRIKNQAAGGGDKGVSGTVSASEANFLGKRWVGEGYTATTTKNGTTVYLSKDGTRQYRGPSTKFSSFATTGTQANFEKREGNSGNWTSNVHVNINDK